MLISVINRAQVTGSVAVKGRIEFNQSKAENGRSDHNNTSGTVYNNCDVFSTDEL